MIGVTSTAMNGFSQSASSNLPVGTWENGIFDYDHLKRSFLSTYTRYWDDASKVPFLYNPSTGIWISYDDLESIGLKNDYIKREQLGGAMFWELSSDRNAELIGSTFNALTNGQTPAPGTNPTTRPTSATGATGASTTPNPSTATVRTTTSGTGGSTQPWQPNVFYSTNTLVTYQGKTYRCLQSHTSLVGWEPAAVAALWQAV